MKKILLPIGVSGRHVHLTKKDVELLFGEGAVLEREDTVRQPEQFKAKQRVTLAGPKGNICNVAIIGPEREESNIEVSITDCYKLGFEIVGENDRSLLSDGPVKMTGPEGEVELREAEVKFRHIHACSAEVEDLGLKDGDEVRVQAGTKRRVIFEKVKLRIKEESELEFQVDTDEANAAKVQTGDVGYLIVEL